MSKVRDFVAVVILARSTPLSERVGEALADVICPWSQCHLFLHPEPSCIQQCPPNVRLHGVSFVVGGETFPAHRAVLAARSPVFRAELLGPMAEAKMSRITIHDVEPVTFRAMLRFIYTDELEEKDSMATDLLQNLVAVADRYDLSRLKLMCAQKLWEKVSVENVATMLIYAEMHGCPELKTSCLDFFVQEENFKVAVLNEGYAQLVQHFPSVIDEIKGLLGAKTMQWSEN
ncbi:BTB/POZ and MATH domain-containing protein 3-like [Oryza glaberrima]|nr:BTB/POZ and MATH domain-containing protein 3-like [Oryza glaberrima]